jgi:ABC-type transport system involved in cytochrome bd biosynthesis fused ATPase/permease subunit
VLGLTARGRTVVLATHHRGALDAADAVLTLQGAATAAR